jgi:peptidoglycan/xylan/chitin deacetylase (PgdA/CDA1 family)
LPILEKYRCPAVFFIATGPLESGGLLPADQWWQNRGNLNNDEVAQPLYMTKADILKLQAIGHEIGAHSDSHPVFKLINAKEQRKEVLLSKQKLENFLEKKVTLFSYPIGGVSQETLDIMKDAGFDLAFVGEVGSVTSRSPRYFLPRISACNYPLPVLALKIQFSIMKSRLFGDKL